MYYLFYDIQSLRLCSNIGLRCLHFDSVKANAVYSSIHEAFIQNYPRKDRCPKVYYILSCILVKEYA